MAMHTFLGPGRLHISYSPIHKKDKRFIHGLRVSTLLPESTLAVQTCQIRQCRTTLRVCLDIIISTTLQQSKKTTECQARLL